MPQLVIPSDIPDAALLFDEAETRQILKFFWPERSPSIDSMSVTDKVRSFGQMILIAAIDASYAMGFIDATFKSIFGNPHASLKSMGQKLARNFFQHWWKHATRKDLENVKIYESVRAQVANNFVTPMDEYINGIASSLRQQMGPFYLMAIGSSSRYWS